MIRRLPGRGRRIKYQRLSKKMMLMLLPGSFFACCVGQFLLVAWVSCGLVLWVSFWSLPCLLLSSGSWQRHELLKQLQRRFAIKRAGGVDRVTVSPSWVLSILYRVFDRCAVEHVVNNGVSVWTKANKDSFRRRKGITYSEMAEIIDSTCPAVPTLVW